MLGISVDAIEKSKLKEKKKPAGSYCDPVDFY